ncbi:unnamed protein product [Ectocarpus sp. 13 AM-2016]
MRYGRRLPRSGVSRVCFSKHMYSDSGDKTPLPPLSPGFFRGPRPPFRGDPRTRRRCPQYSGWSNRPAWTDVFLVLFVGQPFDLGGPMLIDYQEKLWWIRAGLL